MRIYSYRRVLAMVLCMSMLAAFLPLYAAEASFYSVNDEIELGKKASKEVERVYKLSPDKALQERVERLGRPLAAASERPELPYTFKVLEVNEINAFALPGGPVYVFKGLAEFMSDDELAGVLGHEIGHIVKRHSIKQTEKSMGMGLLMLLLLRENGLPLQSLLQQLLMARYSREDEREADYQGFLLTTRAGFNPYSMQLGLAKLAKVSDAPDYGLFSSHPEPEARVAQLKNYLRQSAIRPEVIVTGSKAQVKDGAWQFTTDEATAYDVAGALYRVSQRGPVQPDWFILDSDGITVRVFYNDIAVWNVTSQQAAVAGISTIELANTYVGVFREWAQKRAGG